MANERLYLACTYCIHNPDTTQEGCLFYFAKYYPSTGWYTTAPADFQKKLDEWFDQHKHGTLHGQFVTLFGTDINPMMRSAAEVLKMVGSYLARAQIDETPEDQADGRDTSPPKPGD